MYKFENTRTSAFLNIFRKLCGIFLPNLGWSLFVSADPDLVKTTYTLDMSIGCIVKTVGTNLYTSIQPQQLSPFLRR